MVSRRWTDPRDRRSWRVNAAAVRRLGAGSRRSVPTVAFESLGTPKQLLRVACCPRAEASFADFGDRHLTLCLDAARGGGRIWMHPGSGELWWVRPAGAGHDEERAGTVLRSWRDEIALEGLRGRTPDELSDEELIALVEGGGNGAGASESGADRSQAPGRRPPRRPGPVSPTSRRSRAEAASARARPGLP